MRGWSIALGFALAACGSGGGPFVGGDDIAAPFDSGPDTTLPGFDSGSDAAADASDDSTPFVGGPFLCDECVCDGTGDLCFHSGGGAQKAPLDDGGDDGGPDFGDASACAMDAAFSSCQAIPIDCLLNPTCACILTHHPGPACSCSVDPSGNGFRVDCVYP